MGFCSIYAPNLSYTHIRIWEWMETYLPYVEWINCGDFNMVEWDGDRGGGVGYVISGLERQTWSKCKASLQMFDPNWWKTGVDYGEWFTRSNFR